MNRANEIEYVALDEKREQIPYVRVATPDGRVRELRRRVTAADVAGKARRRMDCLDCHNRPAHRFGSSPERAVDAAIGAGRINAKIPFIRRDAVRALMARRELMRWRSREIERTIREAMPTRGCPMPSRRRTCVRPSVSRRPSIAAAFFHP